MVSLPTAWQKPADIVLASALVGGSMTDFIVNLNPWLAFAGGVLGVAIASVRVFEIVRSYYKGERPKG